MNRHPHSLPNDISPRYVLAKAWPVIIANASTPLLGLADTAVLGHASAPYMLGALALAVLIFNMLFWACGFLRMSTTGFVAQYAGARQWSSVQQVVLSGLAVGLGLALLLLMLQTPLKQLAFALLAGEPEVEQAAAAYFSIRIWGAPATLCWYVITGLLIGLGHTAKLLYLQVALNLLNIVLDVVFGWYLGWQVRGVALGTVITEWTMSLTVLLWLWRTHKHFALPPLAHALTQALRWTELKPLLANNRDIFIRTLFLLLSFAWFTNQSASFGNTLLAANHILLQFISFSAFFLDGFAFVAEALVGKSIGEKNASRLNQAVKVSTYIAALVAVVLAFGFYIAGPLFTALLTDSQAVQQQVSALLPFMAAYVVCSFAAFQLDGIFIGATRAKAMRNASLLAFAGFLLADWCLQGWNERGLWVAFIVYVILRAVFLALRYPQVVAMAKPQVLSDQ